MWHEIIINISNQLPMRPLLFVSLEVMHQHAHNYLLTQLIIVRIGLEILNLNKREGLSPVKITSLESARI